MESRNGMKIKVHMIEVETLNHVKPCKTIFSTFVKISHFFPSFIPFGLIVHLGFDHRLHRDWFNSWLRLHCSPWWRHTDLRLSRSWSPCCICLCLKGSTFRWHLLPVKKNMFAWFWLILQLCMQCFQSSFLLDPRQLSTDCLLEDNVHVAKDPLKILPAHPRGFGRYLLLKLLKYQFSSLLWRYVKPSKNTSPTCEKPRHNKVLPFHPPKAISFEFHIQCFGDFRIFFPFFGSITPWTKPFLLVAPRVSAAH